MDLDFPLSSGGFDFFVKCGKSVNNAFDCESQESGHDRN